MRIACIIYGDLNTISGGYLYDRQLVEYLRKNGDEVDIVSLPLRNYVRHIGDNFSRDVHCRLAEKGYDVILQDELSHPSLFMQNRSLNGCIPIVAIVHHLRISEQHGVLQSSVYRWIEKRYLRSVDAMIFTSSATKSTVAAEGCLAQYHHVAPPAASHIMPGATTAKTIEGFPRLLCVGNVSPRKGMHTILHAMALHKSSDYQLTIAGNIDWNSSYADDLQKIAEHYQLENRVDFVGSVTDEELRRLYESHDIFVMPSQHEGFGIVYLEAMAFALPVIASSAGGAVDLVRDGENGYLVAPENAERIAAVLEKLCDPEQYAMLSNGALESYRRHPNWTTSMRGVRQFIGELVEEWNCHV